MAATRIPKEQDSRLDASPAGSPALLVVGVN
jgi:hypothetical protein